MSQICSPVKLCSSSAKKVKFCSNWQNCISYQANDTQYEKKICLQMSQRKQYNYSDLDKLPRLWVQSKLNDPKKETIVNIITNLTC